MTLTKETIEGWREWVLRRLYPNRNDAEPKELGKQFNALCDLALVGLAVQPRPIAEAPKDGRPLLLYREDAAITVGYWQDSIPGGVDQGWYSPTNSRMDWDFTHFIPLTSLPEPKI